MSVAERQPYSRVYWTIADDDRFATIYGSDAHLATWLRLMLIADQAWPASGHIPAGTAPRSVKALADCGLIELVPPHRYRIHGMTAERTARSTAASNAARNRWGNAGGTAEPMPSRDETRQDEPSQDATTRAPKDEGWDEPEGEALTFLAQHGCYLAPGNGFHRKLVLMVEQHGVGAVLRTMNLLARHGTENGDTKGFIFGADDALRKRPDLKAVKADEIAAIDHAKSERLQAETRHLTEEQERLAASTPMKPLRDLLPRPS